MLCVVVLPPDVMLHFEDTSDVINEGNETSVCILHNGTLDRNIEVEMVVQNITASGMTSNLKLMIQSFFFGGWGGRGGGGLNYLARF